MMLGPQRKMTVARRSPLVSADFLSGLIWSHRGRSRLAMSSDSGLTQLCILLLIDFSSEHSSTNSQVPERSSVYKELSPVDELFEHQ